MLFGMLPNNFIAKLFENEFKLFKRIQSKEQITNGKDLINFDLFCHQSVFGATICNQLMKRTKLNLILCIDVNHIYIRNQLVCLKP